MKDYPWGSDPYYRKNKARDVVDIEFILDIFSKNRQQAIKVHIRFMDTSEMEESSTFEEVVTIGENQETVISK